LAGWILSQEIGAEPISFSCSYSSRGVDLESHLNRQRMCLADHLL
jgi:hypothetical protein